MSAHEHGQKPDETAQEPTVAQRLDSLERIVMRQQEALNDQAGVISSLRRRVGNLEAAGALYGCDGK